MTERKLVAELVKQFNAHGSGWLYKIPDMGSRNPFDCIGCVDGRSIAIEFKKSSGVLKDHQKENLKKHQNAGGISLIGIFRKDRERDCDFYLYGDINKLFTLIWKTEYINISDFIQHLTKL